MILGEIRKKSNNKTGQGRIFEELLVKFFKIDRHYKRDFKKVSLWNSMPAEFRRVKDNPKGGDIGIDIVAETNDGEFYWIQSKFYDDEHDLGRNDILKFVDACKIYGKTNKTAGKIFIHTGNNVSTNARRILEEEKIRLMQKPEFRASSVEWSLKKPELKEVFKLYGYQEDAFDDVIDGFKTHDRGKLIMACGTGKTFVSLKIAEKLSGKGGLVLFLVPSISLIQQSMREWSNNTTRKMNFVAVCSDKTVSKDEEGSIYELEVNATTDSDTLKSILNNRKPEETTIIFSTYHSIKTVSTATKGLEFDVVFCDEAHRTTGVDSKETETDSPFLMIHNKNTLKAKRRLFMTATPRIYSSSGDEDMVKYSMGSIKNEQQDKNSRKWFGPTFHYLSFHDAVHDKNIKALSDFKVKICIIPREYAAQYISILDNDDDDEVKRSLKLAAAWHAMIYPTDSKKPKLLQRVIAFSNTIKNSKIFTGERDGKDTKIIKTRKTGTDDNNSSRETFTGRSFLNIINDYNEKNDISLTASIKHVDGATNALTRRNRIAWLSDSENDMNECRILSNARCLSEGVDVPALDGILFLEPRRSIVDIVQSVGRVMRKVDGKDYGYVILPILVHEDDEEDEAVKKNDDFKVVYDVLNALRSHDADFDWDINIAALADKKKAKISRVEFEVMGVNPKENKAEYEKYLWPVKSRLMKRVGTAKYFEDYGLQIGTTSNIIEEKLDKMMNKDAKVAEMMEKFRNELASQLNVTTDIKTTKRTVANHVILRRVFDALFSNEFAPKNPIVSAFDNLISEINLDGDLLELSGYFDEVNRRMKTINNMDDENKRKGRQELIKQIYDNFLKGVDKKSAEKHGIVYTPIEIIDFIIHSTNDLLLKHFNKSFESSDVKILDPFTGTGAFISRILESGLLGEKINEKYKNDIFANELILLAYYVATVNIETTYQSLKNNQHVLFGGINYTDTLSHDARWRELKRKNDPRAKTQKKLGSFKNAQVLLSKQRGANIDVIIGNPPYSGGQHNYDDENPNISYPELDELIKNTYMKKAGSGAKNAYHDSYIRSIRWMSSRIEESGIVGIVTNASFLRSTSLSGMRASLEEEFDEIIIFDLLGNAGVEGNGRNVFEYSGQSGGSKSPICIIFLIKNNKKNGKNDDGKKYLIKYYSIGSNSYSGSDKREQINNLQNLDGILKWEPIISDKHNDWLDQRNPEFEKYMAIGSNDTRSGRAENTIFKTYGRGVGTSRDVWAYNSSKAILSKNMKIHVDYCNKQNTDKPIINKKEGKWSSNLSRQLKKHGKLEFNTEQIRIALYRPFFKQYLYFDKVLNHDQGITAKAFPKKDSENLVICLPYNVASSSAKFSTMITNMIPDLVMQGAGYPLQCFPLYTYDGDEQIPNILDSTVKEYRQHYNNNEITYDDIFYYIYGMFHHPGYKTKYKNNLMKELPRIPMVDGYDNFTIIKTVGKNLANLHIGYESCKEYEKLTPLTETKKFTKLQYTKKNDENGNLVKSQIRIKEQKKVIDDGKVKIITINDEVLFENIPDCTYVINKRTPLEWVVLKYQKELDKDSHIENNSCDEINIVSIIRQAVFVGIQSEKLIEQLPENFEPKNWKPAPKNLDQHF